MKTVNSRSVSKRRPRLIRDLPLSWERELSPVIMVAWPALLHHGVPEHLLDGTEDGVVVGEDALHVGSAGPPLGKTNY